MLNRPTFWGHIKGLITQSHLSKIENAEINVSAIMLYHLAKRYGKDMSYFFE